MKWICDRTLRAEVGVNSPYVFATNCGKEYSLSAHLLLIVLYFILNSDQNDTKREFFLCLIKTILSPWRFFFHFLKKIKMESFTYRWLPLKNLSHFHFILSVYIISS